MRFEKAISLLRGQLGGEKVIQDADMAAYTSFRCGGRAAALVLCKSMDDLRYTLYVLGGADKAFDCSTCGDCSGSSCAADGSTDGAACCGDDGSVPFMLLGNGTNVLVTDSGYDGIMVKLAGDFGGVCVDEASGTVRAGSAALLSTIAKEAAAASLTGFEFASGIPGSVGGACFMNAGAYGGEMKDVLVSADVISRDGLREYRMDVSEMELGYRHSLFGETGDIVTGVELRLARGDRAEIDNKMKELAEKSNSKQPLRYPSAGSFFKRPQGYFAGGLIEQAGLKGLTVGGAAVSDLHAGFVINKGGATATDVIRLMRLVQHAVADISGVQLEPEVRIIGELPE